MARLMAPNSTEDGNSQFPECSIHFFLMWVMDGVQEVGGFELSVCLFVIM